MGANTMDAVAQGWVAKWRAQSGACQLSSWYKSQSGITTVPESTSRRECEIKAEAYADSRIESVYLLQRSASTANSARMGDMQPWPPDWCCVARDIEP
ncbi:hypothetical protein GGTG_11709 [Gaeumannomyces tritici R3-111a-1]|uniref:Uncharacterized protein n=1 Tax=Gaeumannomyces tritici (strain R3-111a-1) TaxID=644352 RepID=J3PDY6_GAET3|nr:hypothetical protein GGTG_11709 [Gaeumannomyces tritici R3-111a-1]EJT70686.1 hypothetical protein GGTG_11709 [Gaeumannomyces tritici R3-111a-1]